jgi:rubrerythrin
MTELTQTRRGFIALAGGSLGAASLLSACGSDSTANAETSEFGSGDAGILNYLLTLEYTMVDFYKELETSNLFSEAERKALGKFGTQEEEHAAALVRQLKKIDAEPVAKPKTKFALETGPGTLETAEKLEGGMAGAYLGQLPKVEGESLRQKLAEIHSVEGRHSAAIAYIQQRPVTPDGTFAKPLNVDSVMVKFKPFLASGSESTS